MRRFLFAFLLTSALCPLISAPALTLAWDASPDASVTGYRLYVGPAPGNYTNSFNAGLNLTLSVNLVPGGTYYFAAVAFDAAGVESEFSNEISWPAPPAAVLTLQPTPGGFLLLAQLAPNQTNTLQSSIDLTNWLDELSFVSPSNAWQLTLTNAGAPQKFFRVKAGAG